MQGGIAGTFGKEKGCDSAFDNEVPGGDSEVKKGQEKAEKKTVVPIIFKRDVFPEPELPMIQTNSPFSINRLTS